MSALVQCMLGVGVCLHQTGRDWDEEDYGCRSNLFT